MYQRPAMPAVSSRKLAQIGDLVPHGGALMNNLLCEEEILWCYRQQDMTHRLSDCRLYLRFQDSSSLWPLAGSQCSLHSFDGAPSLNEVIDGCIHLVLTHQPVPPLFFQAHDLCREVAPHQVQCLAVHMAPES